MGGFAEDGVVFRSQGFLGENTGVAADGGDDMLRVEETGLVSGEDEVEDCKLAFCSCHSGVYKGLNINVLLAALCLFED